MYIIIIRLIEAIEKTANQYKTPIFFNQHHNVTA